MKVIPREAGRITYSTEIRNLKKKLVLNNYQRSIVIGTILGNGNLCENWSKTNYRLSVRQSVEQKDYIFWKFAILRECILTPPKYYDRTRSISFRTVNHQEFTKFRKLFNGKYRLAVWQKDSRGKFLKIIEPYIVESMRYKIS
jgi:hypothetical protein